ncbi:Protein KOKOPELLI [Senna tora]|uniref:Protein KOKOPELLI n=1 Tax=Senna tora TaxID=362788 RepID=A0A834X8H8_9FABA|nr:Protein KOKOPELLI [Senna tora]
MELEEARTNLRAMRLLYRLLEDNTLGLQNASSEDLVDRARSLLKDMLDETTERTIETILKIIETQAGISKTTCTSPNEKPVASLPLKPLMEANSSQCSLKYPTWSRITSQKDEQPQMKLPAKKVDPWLSQSSISNKGKNKGKTLCRIGEESSSMMEFSSRSSFSEQQHNVSTFHVGEDLKEPLEMFQTKAYEFKEVNETPLLSRIHEIQRNPNASNCVEPLDEEENISNDLVNAIKRIESRILALQLCSYLALSKKSSAGEQSMHKENNSDNPIVQKNEGTAGNELGSGKPLLDRNRLNQQTSQLTSKGKNLTLANGSSSQVANKIHRPEILVDLAERNGITIQGNRQKGEMLLSQNGVQNMTMTNRFQSLNRPVRGNDHLVSQSDASECIHGLRIPLNQDNLTRRSSMLAGSSSTTNEKPIRKNPVVQPYTDKRGKHSSHQISPHLHRDWTVLENRGSRKMRTSLPQHHHESEESISEESSGSSVSWTSQQSSAISSSESEEYLSYDDNSEESGDSYSHNDAGHSHRAGSLKSDKSCSRRNPEKSIGRLRRLKNKLGLIFHHHHYHDEDDSKIAKVDHRHSMWNSLQNIFHGKNKHKVITKGKVEKTRGAVARVPHGKHVGKFHGLVEGLLRHILHSKNQKPSSKVRIKGSQNPSRENRKKLHWWQVLRRHRAVKLKNRGRLKVGFKSKRIATDKDIAARVMAERLQQQQTIVSKWHGIIYCPGLASEYA